MKKMSLIMNDLIDFGEIKKVNLTVRPARN